MVLAWADAQTVLNVTGVEVTDPQLAQAQAAIEVFCGRTYDDTVRLRKRDLYWLGRAVAYQATWSDGQYDLVTRMDLILSFQDGTRSEFREDALVLAPMAARAINRLSWRKSRTLHVRSPFVDGRAGAINPLLESSDGMQNWLPMDGHS